MTAPLPPYSGPEPTCPKCGNEGAATEFRALGECLHETGEQVHTFARNERLHRTCYRCGHQWDEATTDTTPEP
jgi:predicted nucleic-acid-binding Zn-ribbon protein